MDEFIWTTKDGQKLRLEEIGNSHLLDIIKLLERKNFSHMQESFSYIGFLQGEMAIDAAESQIDQELREQQDVIDFLKSDARKRGLKFT